MVKFLRRDTARHSSFGKRRKKLKKWRRPTGRDNKMRERRRGYPVRVSIGYKAGENNQEKIIVRNVRDLEKVQKGNLVLLGNVGKKKKIEILKKANEKGIKFLNANTKKILKKLEKGENKNESR